jgi:hypothetical protein
MPGERIVCACKRFAWDAKQQAWAPTQVAVSVLVSPGLRQLGCPICLSRLWWPGEDGPEPHAGASNAELAEREAMLSARLREVCDARHELSVEKLRLKVELAVLQRALGNTIKGLYPSDGLGGPGAAAQDRTWAMNILIAKARRQLEEESRERTT